MLGGLMDCSLLSSKNGHHGFKNHISITTDIVLTVNIDFYYIYEEVEVCSTELK